MIYIASRVVGFGYKKLLKPVIFKFKPDTIHDIMVNSAERLAGHRIALWLVRATLRYGSPALRQEYHGLVFHNPVGLTAGLDKNAQMPAVCEAVGFGMVEVGTMTIKPCAGNPRPWFFRLKRTKSLAVYAGLANQGVRRNMLRVGQYPVKFWDRMVLNVSVGKTNCRQNADDSKGIKDNVEGINYVLKSGLARMITINISCPNTFGGEPFTDPRRLKRLMDAVAELRPEIPFSVKLPIDKPWPEFRQLVNVLAKYEFIKFVTIGNLAKDRNKIQFLDPLPAELKGNFSGKPTWEMSNHLIAKTFKHYGSRFTIIGVGGVFSPEDAYKKLALGASLVQLATGMIFEGPQLIGQINRYIDHRLQEDRQTIGELIGSAA